MERRYLIYLLLLIVSCSEEKAQEEEPNTVTVSEVIREKVVVEDNYPGNLVALQEVELRADVAGYITNILFEDGQRVRKGQLLYEIDKSRYRSQLEQSESRLRIASSNLERIQRDVNRYALLKEGNAIADQVYENAITDLNNAEQELLAAQAMVDDAETNLRYANIHAPFDGTIGFSEVRLGTLISPGQTLLNIISSDDPIGLDFYAEEKSLHQFLEFQQKGNIALEDSIFTVRLPDGRRYPHPGKIENIDRAIDRSTGTIKIRLSFKNPNLELKAGLSASLAVRMPTDGEQLTIPHKGVVERMGQTHVFTVNGNEAKQVRIETGRKVRDRIIVQKGLEEGETIVLSGIQKLSDGDYIRTKKED